jgi:hypothetical protein
MPTSADLGETKVVGWIEHTTDVMHDHPTDHARAAVPTRHGNAAVTRVVAGRLGAVASAFVVLSRAMSLAPKEKQSHERTSKIVSY